MSENIIGEPPIKILLVDDKKENLVALEKILTPLKLNIFKAMSGDEALRIMLEEDFAVVLLDVMMPIMDGFEVATLMHQNENTKHVPIIFLTAINKSEKFYIQGMEVGAIDYLYKPIDPTILLNKVRVFVDLYRVKNKLENMVEKLNQYHVELEEKNAILKKMAEEDGLTQIANRRHFDKEILRLLNLAEQHHCAMALLFFDVDDFKSINDRYGHPAGDCVLQTIAERLRNLFPQSISSEETFQENIIARVGGDEFAIGVGNLLGDCKHAELVAKQILHAMETPVIYNNDEIKVSISVGIACYPEVANSIVMLKKLADTALYHAKRAGKNRYIVFKDTLYPH